VDVAGKILILRWTGSAYDSIGGLLEEVAQEFVALGRHVLIFVADTDNWPERLVQVLQQGDIAFVLTMSGIGMDSYLHDRTLLWDAVKIPIFNWSCDHPCHYPPRHGIRSRFVLHGYVFPDHGQYNIQHLNPNGIAFGIHIGLPARRLFPEAPLPLSQRNGRIIFTKSGSDTNKIEAQWQQSNPTLRRLLFDASEELLHCNTGAFLPVLQRLGAQRGLLLSGNNTLALWLIAELDFYNRFRRGNLLMQALLDYPVDVFGNGWDHLPWSGARAVLHAPIPWRENAVQRLPHYLGCLSINPLVEQSVHDRVFFALSAGVVPLSDANAFSTTHTPSLEPYSFDFTPERIRQAADMLLADPAEAVARTETAWQALSSWATMRHAAMNIMQFVALHDTNARVAV
jgi:hypothetical protein